MCELMLKKLTNYKIAIPTFDDYYYPAVDHLATPL